MRILKAEGKQANKCKFTKWQWLWCKSGATASFQRLLLGVPTYLPTYNSSMLTLSPKTLIIIFQNICKPCLYRLDKNHKRAAAMCKDHTNCIIELQNQNLIMAGSGNWDYQEAREYCGIILKSPDNGNETCRMMQVYWSYTCLDWSDNTLDNTSVAPGTLLASKFPQQWQEILKLNVDSLLPSVWPASVSIQQSKNNQLSTTVTTTQKSSNCTTPHMITAQFLSLSFF